MLYVDQNSNVNAIITGRKLAHAKRSAIARALVAADLHVGRLSLVEPTVIQAAALARVSVGYAHAAIAIVNDKDARAAVLAGRVPLVVASWANESLADRYMRSSADERVELREMAGVDHLWDELIAPGV